MADIQEQATETAQPAQATTAPDNTRVKSHYDWLQHKWVDAAPQTQAQILASL